MLSPSDLIFDMVTLEDPDLGGTSFTDYWFAPGTRLHLHVPGVTMARGSVFAHMEPNQWDYGEGKWGMINIHKKKVRHLFDQ